MKKFVLLWSVILAIALVGSAFAIDSSELRSSTDRTVLVEEKAVLDEQGAITATSEYQQKDRSEKVFRLHPSLVTVPPNDLCENAEFVPGPFPATGPGSTIDATLDCPGLLDWNAVWYVFDLPNASNDVFIEVCPDNIDLYTIGIILMDDCACDDYILYTSGLFGTCASGYLGFTMEFIAVPGPATWYWPCYAVDAAMQGLDFQWTIDIIETGGAPPNDFCETAEAIGLVENQPFSTTQATASGYGDCMTSADIWYVYTAEYSGPTVVSLCGSEYDTKLAVYDGDVCDPLSPEIECNDDFCGLQSQITYNAVEGNEYLIQVGGYSSNVGDGVISIMPPPSPQCCQVVIPPEGSWNFITSDTDLGYTVFDNYICDYGIGEIVFQGLDLHWTGSGWEECVEDPMDFNVKFYPDVGAYPDTANPVCEYTVTPIRTATGIMYGDIYELVEYSIALPGPCSQAEGWLSIQGVGNGETCVFMWGAATSGDGLSYQRYPDGSMVQRPDDLSRCMFEGVGVSMSCELLTPIFCRGKSFYFTLTVNNSTGGDIRGTLTFTGYAGYDCDPANFIIDVVRDKTYPDGETQEYYYYNVCRRIEAGQYSASIGGTLGGFDLYCCFNGDIIECGPFKNGDNTGWSLVQVDRPEAALPTVTSLAQNYPNPFNAATNISFDLAEAGNVSLKVYDITGRLVVTLVDGQMDAGQHVVVWDASNVSSGVYFYKLTAGDYTATKKMNLLK